MSTQVSLYFQDDLKLIGSVAIVGDLENEKKVLNWLLEFRDTVDDPDEYVEDSDEIEGNSNCFGL